MRAVLGKHGFRTGQSHDPQVIHMTMSLAGSSR
jgi:hypothetical protein